MSSTGDITSTSSSRWCGVCSAIFHSGDPVLRNFGLLLVAVVGMAMFFILAYPMGKYGLEGTPVCTASAAAVGLLAIMAAPFSSSSMITYVVPSASYAIEMTLMLLSLIHHAIHSS